MEDQSTEEGTVSIDTHDESVSTVSRPDSLNIDLTKGVISQLTPIPSQLEDLLPLLTDGFAKYQALGNLLNSKTIAEVQELLTNKKLDHLQESPSVATPELPQNSFNVHLPGVTPQNLTDLTEFLRQAVQQPRNIMNSSILLCPPVGFSPNTPVPAQLSEALAAHDPQKPVLDSGSQAALTLPLSIPAKDALQLATGLKFEIKANGPQQASVLKMLGLSCPQVIPHMASSSGQSDSHSWPMQVQNIGTTDGLLSTSTQSSHLGTDNRPSSTATSLDPPDANLLPRPASSISSTSSTSQANSRDLSSNNPDARLDPSEQYRMRLERKRARNRDAARKCRERKIRLIKSLEKDVHYLSEENKSLRFRIARSKTDVDRLRQFVSEHVENKCPIINA